MSMTVPTKSLGAFLPLSAEGPLPHEAFPVLRSCSSLFHLRPARVYFLREQAGEMLASAGDPGELSLGSVVLKVAAMATIILPVGAVLGALTYSRWNAIKVDPFERCLEQFNSIVTKADAEALAVFLQTAEFQYLVTVDARVIWTAFEVLVNKDHSQALKMLLERPDFPRHELMTRISWAHLAQTRPGIEALIRDQAFQGAAPSHIRSHWIEFSLAQKTAFIKLKGNVYQALDDKLFEALVGDCMRNAHAHSTPEWIQEGYTLVKAVIDTPSFEKLVTKKLSLIEITRFVWSAEQKYHMENNHDRSLGPRDRVEASIKVAQEHFLLRALLCSKYYPAVHEHITGFEETVRHEGGELRIS